MENVNIRRATLEDMAVLLEFEQGVIGAERAFDVTLKQHDTRYYDIEEMIIAPHIELAVAGSGTEIIGSGYARIEASKPYLQHAKYAYLGFMYVRPAYRGQGINQMLIGYLQEWVRAQGITE